MFPRSSALRQRDHVASVFVKPDAQGDAAAVRIRVIYRHHQQAAERPREPISDQKTGHNPLPDRRSPADAHLQPGRSAIKPAPSKDLYFVADGTGATSFPIR